MSTSETTNIRLWLIPRKRKDRPNIEHKTPADFCEHYKRELAKPPEDQKEPRLVSIIKQLDNTHLPDLQPKSGSLDDNALNYVLTYTGTNKFHPSTRGRTSKNLPDPDNESRAWSSRRVTFDCSPEGSNGDELYIGEGSIGVYFMGEAELNEGEGGEDGVLPSIEEH
jgi:hypothetical protein